MYEDCREGYYCSLQFDGIQALIEAKKEAFMREVGLHQDLDTDVFNESFNIMNASR
jgi:hypothetical protein